jgi:hypothetical protein
MKLMMFLSNELIDTIPLCRESITLPGYLGKMKRELQVRNGALIESLDVEPVFLVENAIQIDSRLRRKKHSRSQRKNK